MVSVFFQVCHIRGIMSLFKLIDFHNKYIIRARICVPVVLAPRLRGILIHLRAFSHKNGIRSGGFRAGFRYKNLHVFTYKKSRAFSPARNGSKFGRLCARRGALAVANGIHGRQDLCCLSCLTCRKLLLKIDLRHKRRVLSFTVSQGGLDCLSLNLTL